MSDNFNFDVAIGYHSANSMNIALTPQGRCVNIMDSRQLRATKSAAFMTNILKITSYFPVIGTIVGIVALAKMSKLNDAQNFRPELNALSVRAWVQIFSVGFVFLFPDVFVTIRRAFTSGF